jgi:hypothetical protein
MMQGIEKALSNTGCPWPGGGPVSFEQADILQLGKLYCWGSSCVQFIVRLRDQREVFVRADKQRKEDERFLRRLAKPIRGGVPGRATGFCVLWGAEIAADNADHSSRQRS